MPTAHTASNRLTPVKNFVSPSRARRFARIAMPLAVLIATAGALGGAPAPVEYSFKVIARSKTQTAQPNAIGIPNNTQLSANFAIDDQGNAIVRYQGLFGGDGVVRYSAADNSVITLATTVDGDLAEVDARDGVFATRDFFGVIRTYELNGASRNTFSLGGPAGTTGSINNVRLADNGRVAYRAQAGNDVKYILDEFTATPPSTRSQFTYLTAAAPITFMYSPTVNGSGQLAARIDATTGPSSFGQIRRYNAPPQTGFVTTIDLAGNATFNSISQLLDMNDGGQIAYYARLTGTPTLNLYRTATNGVTRTLIANPTISPLTTSEFANFPPAISETGLVAFRARDFNGQAIYLGDGASLNKIIGNGDTITTNIGALNIAASTVFTGGVRINSRDQVLFIARLSDGSDALIIASPPAPRCSPADIANDDGSALPPIGQLGVNNGVTEGDYNLFFANFFDANAITDIANDDGSPLPPFGQLTTNNGVTEADYNLFFSIFFDGCSN
ncbi:MAG: hypothetical protein K2X32_12755 [Phycisphaerales bacterium]|nr:hypothetical protein [Phycisphaerales bacterium]